MRYRELATRPVAKWAVVAVGARLPLAMAMAMAMANRS